MDEVSHHPEVDYPMRADVTLIPPGKQLRADLPVYSHRNLYDIVVSFEDSEFRTWHMELNDDQAFVFTSRRYSESIYRRTAHGQHFSRHLGHPPGYL